MSFLVTCQHLRLRREVKGITGKEGLEYIYDCVSWDYVDGDWVVEGEGERECFVDAASG